MWNIARHALISLLLLGLAGCGPSGSSNSGTPTEPEPTPGDIQVSFTATPETGYAPLTVSLDASATKSNTGSAVASYAWVATDSAGTEVQSASGKTTTMAFVAKGTYTVKLTASDAQARYGVAQKVIVVSEKSTDTPTPASAVIAVNDGSAPLSVVLDGSGSKPAEGASIVSYLWSVADSAGNLLESASGVTATIVFAAEGTYTVTLTITDSKGNTATAKRNVSVAYNSTLEASFSVTPSVGTVPFDITLDGSASEADGVQIRSYAWALKDADGNTVQSANGKKSTMAIVTAASYIISLTVTDELGRTATAHRTILAEAPATEEQQ